MPSEPRLSICIATRNRGEFIAETIRSIAVQSPGDVEIVILDGASSDDTPAVIQGLQQQFPGLRYVRQESNGGVDRDYDLCVGHARGEYVWLMSDDDVLKEGAVAQVRAAIMRGCSLVVVNAELRDRDLRYVLDERRLQLDFDREYSADEFDRMFEDLSGYLSYIGAVVMRRDLWQSRDREKFYGSCFIHVGVIFQARLPGPTLVIAEPLISIRFGNTQWRPREFEIRMVRWTELVDQLGGVRSDVRHRVYRPDPWCSMKSLLFYRAKGTYDLGDYRRWVRPRTTLPLDRARAFMVAIFPGPLANLIGLAYCRMPYRDSNIHLLDMRISRFHFRNWFRARR